MISKVLVIAGCSWAVAQLLKVVIILVREHRLELRYFVASGSMPSAHSATVCALATAVAITQGLDSIAFAITVILAVVVMYDAAGVRQSVGKQSIILDRIVKELRGEYSRDGVERNLRELVGHTSFQVVVGAALGILIAWLPVLFAYY